MQPYVKSGPVFFFLHPRGETVLKWVTVLSLLLPPKLRAGLQTALHALIKCVHFVFKINKSENFIMKLGL